MKNFITSWKDFRQGYVEQFCCAQTFMLGELAAAPGRL
jgi:hypothetical protein